jgi:hypothetical protein
MLPDNRVHRRRMDRDVAVNDRGSTASDPLANP